MGEMFRNPTPANFKARQETTKRNRKPLSEDYKVKLAEAKSVEDVRRVLDEIKELEVAAENAEGKKATPKPKSAAKSSTKKAKSVPTPSVSNMDDDEESEELSLPELSDEYDSVEEEKAKKPVLKRAASSRQSGRAKGKKMSYAEDEEDEEL